jgi:hypothetical protein
MRRLNPTTGEPFKQGDVREDGYLFLKYNIKDIKRNGEFKEDWLSPASFEKQKESIKLYYVNNAERLKELAKRWSKANPDKTNAKYAKRRAAQLQRTPPWLTKEQLLEIESFYAKAKDLQTLTGIEFHVDHIVPLQGKLVSGLHVPWNLQVIPAVENLKKSNNYEPTFENATADVA